MKAASHYQPTQEPVDVEERILMDPETWDWDSTEPGVTAHEPAVTIRFTREEYVALWRQAQSQGLTTPEFIKRSALEAAHTTVR